MMLLLVLLSGAGVAVVWLHAHALKNCAYGLWADGGMCGDKQFAQALTFDPLTRRGTQLGSYYLYREDTTPHQE